MPRSNRHVSSFVIILATFAAAPARAQSETPIAPLGPEAPAAPPREVLLRAGESVTLRIRQVIPRDGLSPAERMLNSLPAAAEGDRVLAEIVAPGRPALIGGTILRIEPPQRFGRPGRITLQLGQLVTSSDGRSGLAPWLLDLEDKRFNTRVKRKILLALFAAEGAGIGASIGSQLTVFSNPLFIGGGAGVGLLSGIGYASLMRGRQATIEPGDTFQVRVGSISYRPVPLSAPLKINPAQDPASGPKRSRKP